MRQKDIVVGGRYIARVNSKYVVVRVDAIREVGTHTPLGARRSDYRTRYDVTNLHTGRKTTFRSAIKFREPATIDHPDTVGSADPQGNSPDTGFNNRHED